MKNKEIAEEVRCEFKIIQSPDLEHLRIIIQPFSPDNFFDDHMLSLKLRENLPTTKAQQLESLLDECVEALWVVR